MSSSQINKIKLSLQQAINDLNNLPSHTPTSTTVVQSAPQISSTEQVMEAVSRMTNEDINTLVEHIQLRRQILSRTLAITFALGDKVEFKDRSGGRLRGVIHKKPVRSNEKNFKIKQVYNHLGQPTGQTWRVAPGSIQRIPPTTVLSEPF